MSSFVATHEAGHAVASLVLGGFPERATIHAEGDSLGHVQEVPGWGRAVARAALFGRGKADRDLVMGDLVAVAAGPVAESIAAGALTRSYPFPWDMWGGAKDGSQIELILEKAGGLLHADIDAVVDEAVDLLRDPSIWASVERVAKSLERWVELSYEEIQLAVLGDPI